MYRQKGVRNNIPVEPLLPWMTDLIEKLTVMQIIEPAKSFAGQAPDAILINFYDKGGGLCVVGVCNANLIVPGIPPHIDHKGSFQRPIFSVRLMDDCPMQFGTYDKYVCLLFCKMFCRVVNDILALLITEQSLQYYFLVVLCCPWVATQV
jgi:hypothetical protein